MESVISDVVCVVEEFLRSRQVLGFCLLCVCPDGAVSDCGFFSEVSDAEEFATAEIGEDVENWGDLFTIERDEAKQVFYLVVGRRVESVIRMADDVSGSLIRRRPECGFFAPETAASS